MNDAETRFPGLVGGRYRVLRTLGRGGMGEVYLAEHVEIEKRVALKVLHPEYAARPEIGTRFRQEAISASRVRHPNVLDVSDFGELETGGFFIVMELLEGHDLERQLAEQPVVDARRALGWVRQICSGLAAAHEKAVVHRDMKPANVFLHQPRGADEVVKIVDFGIARLRRTDDGVRLALTQPGAFLGTPEYMSPEQALGGPVDQRTDVYSVGVIVYRMFAGTTPFANAPTLQTLIAKLVSEPPPPIVAVPGRAVSRELEAAVLRALAKAPEERYASMNEFWRALEGTPEGRGASPSGRSAGALQELALAATEFRSAPEPRVVLPVPAETPAPSLRASTPEPSRPAFASVRRGVVPIAFGAIAAALLAFLSRGLLEPKSPLPPIESTPSASTPAASLPPIESTPSASTPAASAAEVRAVRAVKLMVLTDPPGGRLTRDGKLECSLTPCTIEAQAGDRILLEATLGKRRGVESVLVQAHDNVIIVLKDVTAPRPNASAR